MISLAGLDVLVLQACLALLMVAPYPTPRTGADSPSKDEGQDDRTGLRLLRASSRRERDDAQRDAAAADRAERRTGAPARAKEGEYESFEKLKADEKPYRRYLRIRDAIHKLFPVLESELIGGDKVIEMRQQLAKVLEDETDPAKKAKIAELLKLDPQTDKSKQIKELAEIYKDDPKRKALFENLLVEDKDRTTLAGKIADLKRGEESARLLTDLLSGREGLDQKATLASLIDLSEKDSDKKILRDQLAKILISEGLHDPTGLGKPALEQLRSVFTSDAAKTAVLDDILSGKISGEQATAKLKEMLKEVSSQRNPLPDLLKRIEQENFQRTKEIYPIAAARLEREVPNDVVELGLHMLKGTKKDARDPFPTHFFEDCPIKLPDVKAGDTTFKATWEGFLGRVARGEEKLSLSHDLQDLLSESNGAKTARFINATNWYCDAETSIAREDRIHSAGMLNDKLQNVIHAPKSWEMPDATDGRRLDQWFMAAAQVNSLMEAVTGYAQGYLDLQELDPDIAKQTDANSPINKLREMGATIEWDPRTRRITNIELPMPKSPNLLLPENAQILADLRQWIQDYHEPVDRAAEAYAKGRASWLRWGDFREPVDETKPPGDPHRKAAVYKDAAGRELRVENCQGDVVTIWHNDEVIHRNAAGRFINKAGQEITDIPKSDTEQRVEFDYTRNSFTARRTGRFEGEGDQRREIIEVSAERRYCQESAFNFERWGSDIDALTGSQLSTVAVASEKLDMREGQRIVVQDSVTHQSQLLRSEDLLDDPSNFGGWRWQQEYIYHHGAKLGDMGLNIGLTVSGGAEVVALKSAGSVALGALRFTIGATGFLEPALRAGAFDGSLGQLGMRAEDVERLRTGAIMLDVFGIPAMQGGLRWLSGSRAVQAASAVGRVGKILEATESLAQWPIYGGMALTAPALGQELYTDWRTMTGHFGSRNGPLAIEDRRSSFEDFRKAHPEFKLSDPKAQAVIREVLDTYADTLSLGTNNPEVKEKVHQLFAEAKEVAGLPADDPKRKAFIAKLIGYHKRSGEELLLDTLTSSPDYTEGRRADDIPRLDRESQANRETVTRLGQGPKLADFSEQERIAAMQCLVILSTKEDGTLPATGVIASREVQVPGHHAKGKSESGDERWDTVGARAVTQEIRIEDALSYLSSTAATGRTDLIRHVRELDQPPKPLAHLTALLNRDGVDSANDNDFVKRKEEASQYLRIHLFLSTDDANKFVDNLTSSDEGAVRAAQEELAKRFADASPANKYLRQQLNMSVAEADAFLKRLNWEDSDPKKQQQVRQAAESELKDKLDTGRNANHLAAGDTLWWHGRFKGDYNRQLLSICMDIASNPSLPEELRAKAIVDRNSPRLGLLISEVAAQDTALAARPHEQQPYLLGTTNLATAQQARELLYSIAAQGNPEAGVRPGQKPPSNDLRSLCALALLANQQETVEERRAFLGELNRNWETLSTKPNAFASHSVALLQQALEAKIDDAPNGSEWRVRKDKFDAAMTLLSLGNVGLEDGKSFKLDENSFNTRLLESISAKPTDSKPPHLLFEKGHEELTQLVLQNLRYDKLSLEQRQSVLEILSIPVSTETDPARRSEIEYAKLIVMRNLPALLNHGEGGREFDKLRESAAAKLQDMFNMQSPLYAAGMPDLRAASIEALRDIGWRDAQMREFLEDRLRPATTNGRPDGPVAKDAEGHVIWREPPAVRLAALQALYKMNSQDPGRIATGHRDLEDDPLVGRVAQNLERLRAMHRPGDPREQARLTEHLELKLLAPSQCDPDLGKDYVKSSRYKLLLSEDLSNALAGTLSGVYGDDIRGTLQQGYARTGSWPLSWSQGLDRIKHLDINAPGKKYDAAVDKFFSEYSTLARELCDEALAVPDRTKGLSKEQVEENQRKALSAMVWFLRDNCEKCRPEDQKAIRTMFAATLANLCGTEIKVSGSDDRITVSTPIRHLAYEYLQSLLKESVIKADAQTYFLDAIHRLHRDGAIDTATAVEHTTTLLKTPIKDQTVRTPQSDDYEDFKKVHLTALNDLLSYRARCPEVMSTISAMAGGADGHPPGHPIPEVRERARVIKDLLENGVTLTREDIRTTPDEGTTPQRRAEMLQDAIRTPTENNANVISEIFRAVSGNPITQPDDPRLPVLLSLADTAEDPRVKAALAHAFLDVAALDGRVALRGLSMLSELKATDHGILGREASERLAWLEKSDVGKGFLPLLQKDNEARANSILRGFWECEGSRNAADAKSKTDELAALSKADFASGNDAKDYSKLLAAAWGANGFDAENKKLVDVCRQLLTFSKDEKTLLSAAYAIVHCKTADRLDLEAAQAVIKRLQSTGSSSHIREDASKMLDPKLEAAAHSQFSDLLTRLRSFREPMTFSMTDGELERASGERMLRYAEDMRSVLSREQFRLEQLRIQAEELKRTRDELRHQQEQIDLVLKEGIARPYNEVQASSNPTITVEKRIADFNKALAHPGDNNEALLRAIFNMTAGKPITDGNDPRVALLARLGYTTTDTRIQEAVGYTLLLTPQGQGTEPAFRAGLWMIADVATRGTAGQKIECNGFLDQLASRDAEERKAVAELRQEVLKRSGGVLSTIFDAQHGVAKQERINDNAKLAEKIKELEQTLANPKLPGRLKVQALADAWTAGDFQDPTKQLLPLTRALAQTSPDEQVRLAALAVLNNAPAALQLEDLNLVRTGLERLATSASNPHIKEEAAALLPVFKKQEETLRPTLEASRKAQEAFDQLNREGDQAATELRRLEAQLADLQQMEKEGVHASQEFIRKTGNPNMSVEDRIKLLDQAIATPGDNNENIVRAVFQLVLGKRITDENDPRLSALYRLGYSHQDTRVLTAVASTLLQEVDLKDQNFRVQSALWMFGDVLTRGKKGQIREAQEALKPLGEKVDIEQLARNLNRLQNEGVWSTFKEAQSGASRQNTLDDPAATAEKVRRAESALNDGTIPERLKMRWLCEAWLAGGYTDSTGTLLPMSRKILQESNDDQMKLIAFICMRRMQRIKGDQSLPNADLSLMKATIKDIAQKGRSPKVRQEARDIIASNRWILE